MDASTIGGLKGRNARSRKDRPCDVCRRRKVRCYIEDGAKQCALCRAEAFECTFQDPPSKRKRPNHDGHPPPSRSKSVGSKAETHIRTFSSLTTPDNSMPELVGEGSMSDMHNSPNSFGSHGALPSPSLSGAPTLIHYGGATAEHVGLSGDNMPELGTGDIVPHFPRFKMVREDPRDRPIYPNEHHITMRSDTTLEEIFDVVRPHGQALVDLYVQVVHPIVPVIESARCRATAQKLVTRTGDGVFDDALCPLFAAIFVIASHWWSFDPALGMQPAPDVTLLREFVRHVTLTSVRLPRLITVQAMMMQFTMLAFHSQSKNSEIWAAMGTLYSTAQNLGLHENPDGWQLTKWERSLRKRLWWTFFTHEKFLAHSLGRLSHVQYDAYSVTMLEERDFEDGIVPPHMKSMTELSLILSDVLSTLYSPRTTRGLTDDIQATLTYALPLLDQSEAWYKALPLSLSMSDTGSADGLNSNGSVHLSYFVVRISLHRAIMRCKGIPSQVYRQAAVTTMEDFARWTKTLTASHVVAVWPTHSRFDFAIVASFIIALLFTSESEQDFQAVHTVLQSFRWTLSLHSRSSSELTGSALSRIDVFCASGIDSLRTLWKRRRDLAVFQYKSTANTRSNTPMMGDSGDVEIPVNNTHVYPLFPSLNSNSLMVNDVTSHNQFPPVSTEIGFDFYNSPLSGTSNLFWGNNSTFDGTLPYDLWHLNEETDTIHVGLMRNNFADHSASM